MNISSLSGFRGRWAWPMVASATGALFVIGCLGPETGGVGTGRDGSPDGSSAQGLEVLVASGFARDRIVEMEDGFVVEGDMFFLKEALAAGSPDSRKGLAKVSQRSARAVNAPAPHTLRLAMHSSLAINATWKNAVYQAVNNINNLKTRLHIDVVPWGASGNITVYSDESASCPSSLRNLPSNVAGRAFTFLTGEVGYAACINMDHSALGPMRQKVSTLTHEIGHTVALYHTDGSEGTLIAGTTNGDAASIMNSSSGSTGILSHNDILAFELLYPGNKPLGGSNLDGDTKDDLAFYRPSDGYWGIAQSSTNYTTSTWPQWGERGDLPMEDMDIDGDGKDDLVVWRPRDGYWHIINSRDNSYRGIQFGQLGDVPISNSDTDGDGKDDLVLFRWHTSQFFVSGSRNNYVGWTTYNNFGQAGDIPVGGIDQDKDRKDDLVFYRPVEARFYIARSTTGFANYFTYNLGQSGDIPVGSCDFDRDGWDDLVVWNPATGNWITLNSSINLAFGTTKQWGQRGDVPMIGTDFDRDGKRDITVWRPSDARWYILPSGTNFTTWYWWSWG